MVVLVLIVLGLSSLYYAAPTTFDPVVNSLYSSNESSNINISNNSVVKKINNKTSPDQGYSEVIISGLKFYIKTDDSNFTNTTSNSSIINSIGFINNSNIADESSETNSTNITNLSDVNSTNITNLNDVNSTNITNLNDVNSTNITNPNDVNSTNITNSSDELSNNTNSTNLVNYVEYNDANRLYASNGSFDIIITNNSAVEEAIDMIISESAINSDNGTSIVNMGNNLTIVHYNQYFDENYIGEMTWVLFKVNDKVVSIGWAGNNVDMYVIDSFFKLN